MENLYTKILKVNHATGEIAVAQFANEENLKLYLQGILEEIAESEGDRQYHFHPDKERTKNLVGRILAGNNEEDACEALARKLNSAEFDAQKRVDKLGVQIQRGVLIVSYVKMTETDNKLIISKADYTEFMEEDSGQIKFGLATRKRLFKSFVINYSLEGGCLKEGRMVTYDTNRSKTSYWWKDFLELEEERNNTANTKAAFDEIKSRILEPIEKKYKSDYIELWNRTVGYFRIGGEFELDYYRDIIIGTYTPFEGGVDVDGLKTKISALSRNGIFDLRFEKDPTAVQSRFKKNIELTPEIDLVLKHNMAAPGQVLRPYEDEDGERCLLIKSEKGYEYAEKLPR